MKRYLILLFALTSCYEDYSGMMLSEEQINKYNTMRNRTFGFIKHNISITETNIYGDILLDNGYVLHKIHKGKYIFIKQEVMSQKVINYSEYIRENYNGE